MMRARFVLLLSLTVNACDRREITFEADRATGVRTIAIEGPAISENPDVTADLTGAVDAGPLGYLMNKVEKSVRDDKLKAVLDAAGFDAWKIFTDALTIGLRAKGYTVLAGARLPYRTKFSDTPPRTDADATLDIAITGYGYRAIAYDASANGVALKDTPLRPFVDVLARLRDRGSGKVLMRARISYFPVQSEVERVIPTDIVAVAPDPKYAFANLDALRADAPGATAGLRSALSKTAVTLADLLGADNDTGGDDAAAPGATEKPLPGPRRTDCAEKVRLTGAVKLDMFDPVKYIFAEDAACVVNRGGVQSVYAVFAIPHFTKPSALSIRSQVTEDGTLFAPKISLLHADGSESRQIADRRVQRYEGGIGVTVRPRPDEAYLVIRSNNSKFGERPEEVVTGYLEETTAKLTMSATGRIVIQPEFVFDDK